MACVVRDDSELLPSLPLSPKCWDYRCVTLHHDYLVLGQNGGSHAYELDHTVPAELSPPLLHLSIQAPARLDWTLVSLFMKFYSLVPFSKLDLETVFYLMAEQILGRHLLTGGFCDGPGIGGRSALGTLGKVYLRTHSVRVSLCASCGDYFLISSAFKKAFGIPK